MMLDQARVNTPVPAPNSTTRHARQPAIIRRELSAGWRQAAMLMGFRSH
jgi:hypothetical protein